MSEYRIIDVSQWMDDFVFDEEQEFVLKGPFNRVPGNNPEFVYDFDCCTQSGTHIQGPHYFLEQGETIESFPLSSFEGNAAVLDLTKKGEDTTKEDLVTLLSDVPTDIEILILRTGNMDEVIQSGHLDPSRRPGLSLEAARYLVQDFKVKMLAIDSVGFESRVTQNYEVNVYLCSEQVLLLEGLVNLHEISRREVFLEAFPLKIRRVEGTPCRAIVKELI